MTETSINFAVVTSDGNLSYSVTKIDPEFKDPDAVAFGNRLADINDGSLKSATVINKISREIDLES